MKFFSVIALAALLSGCASPGRVCLVEVNALRKPQIEAMRAEALAPYACPSSPANAAQSRTAVPWSVVPDILKVGFRLRVGSWEWGACPNGGK